MSYDLGFQQRLSFAEQALLSECHPAADTHSFANALHRARSEGRVSPALTLTWIYLVSLARYPSVDELQDGIFHLESATVEEYFNRKLASPDQKELAASGVTVELRAPSASTLHVDVSHTFVYTRISGIQRVVRNLCREWESGADPVNFFVFRNSQLRPSYLTPEETRYFCDWESNPTTLIQAGFWGRVWLKLKLAPYGARIAYHKGMHPLIHLIDQIFQRVAGQIPWIGAHLGRASKRITRFLIQNVFARDPYNYVNGSPLLPRPKRIEVPVFLEGRSLLHMPELAAEHTRVRFYLSLLQANPAIDFSLLVYDFIPLFWPEFSVAPDGFADHMRLFRVANRFSCISEEVARQTRLLCRTLRPDSKGYVEAHDLPGDLAVLEGHTLEREISLKPTVLCVGTIEVRKNQLAVLRAAQLAMAKGHNFRLLFVGNFGWLNDEFMNTYDEMRQKGMDVEMIISAPERRLRQLYRDCDFTVFCSHAEGFGLPIVESLEAGKPAVVSDRGSMKEIADRSGGCLLVDPDDLDQIAAGIMTLLTDREIYRGLQQSIRLDRGYSWKEYAQRVRRFLHNNSSASC